MVLLRHNLPQPTQTRLMRVNFPETLCIDQGVVPSCRFSERKVGWTFRVLWVAAVSQSSVKSRRRNSVSSSVESKPFPNNLRRSRNHYFVGLPLLGDNPGGINFFCLITSTFFYCFASSILCPHQN